MASLVANLPITDFHGNLLSDTSSPSRHLYRKDDERLLEQLTDQSQQSPCSIYGNIRSDAPIIIWLGHQCSPLRMKLIRYLAGQDIILILFSIEEYLWQWLNSNPSLKVVSLILQPSINTQQLIARSHSYVRIRSILVRCATTELITLERFTRAYPKVDGIYDDDQRLLSKLMIHLIFLSEELGDHFREDESNEIAAQKNYDRALKLCAIAKTI